MKLRGTLHWLPNYLAQSAKRKSPRPGQDVHLLLCIADHYEPRNGGASADVARQRVAYWIDQYPQVLGQFRDSDGRPPRHSFFYPMEQYVESDISALSDLCRRGFGEIEIHLHHDRDNAESLRKNLLAYKSILAEKHGMLARDPGSGEIRYGFVHGDWALDNALGDGTCCGVNDELTILRQTGCYADFTMPAAPDPAQTKKINSIYYASSDPNRCKAHDTGIDIGTAPAPEGSLMLIQGPLIFNWHNRKAGLFPRIENGCLQYNQFLDIARLDLWLTARVQVPSRPDWFFVKLHSHGAPEANANAFFSQKSVQFHQALAQRAAKDSHFHFHYVTAREMYNLATAAEAGWGGSVADALDYRLVWNAAPRTESRSRKPAIAQV